MNNDHNILDEYDPPALTNRGLINIVSVLMLLFVAYIVYSNFWERKSELDWMHILIGIIIPATGLVLFYARKKAGWFISVVYFSIISITVSAANIKLEMDGDLSAVGMYTLRTIAFFALLLTLTILLWLKKIRLQMVVDKQSVLIALFCIIILSGIIILMMFNA